MAVNHTIGFKMYEYIEKENKMNKDMITRNFNSDILGLIDSELVICYLNITGLLNKIISLR